MEQLFQRVDTVFLRANNFERAFRWYNETLGLPVIWRTDVIAAFKVGDKSPITLVKKDAVAEQHPLCHFFAEDIARTHEELQKRGVSVGPIRDYGTVQLFDFTDSEGHLMNVCHY